ncbi:MAG: hypothetical protein ACPL88_03495, partial [Bryobacteraceae bacterium]
MVVAHSSKGTPACQLAAKFSAIRFQLICRQTLSEESQPVTLDRMRQDLGTEQLDETLSFVLAELALAKTFGRLHCSRD